MYIYTHAYIYDVRACCVVFENKDYAHLAALGEGGRVELLEGRVARKRAVDGTRRGGYLGGEGRWELGLVLGFTLTLDSSE